jgi:hypothetical protein
VDGKTKPIIKLQGNDARSTDKRIKLKSNKASDCTGVKPEKKLPAISWRIR